MRQLSFRQVTIWFLLSVTVIIGCQCDKKPTEPEPIITETDYPVYFKKEGAIYENFIFKYIPETNELDSIIFPYVSFGFLISPNGKQIYFGSPTNAGLEVYYIETQEKISVLPFSGKVSFSSDSQLIAISDGTELNVINANDYSLVFHDTTDIARTIFTRDNKKLFCFNNSTPNLLILDRENNFSKTEKQIDALTGHPIPSYDGQKLFFLNYFHWDASAFEVYDFSVDSVIFRNIHSPGNGFVTISPDGKYVFFTNPGTLLVGTFPPPYFNAYDVEKNELLEISTLNFPGTENDSIKGMIAQEVATTADGKWLTAIGLGGYIVSIEIENMIIVKSRKVTIFEHTWWNLTSSVLPPQ